MHNTMPIVMGIRINIYVKCQHLEDLQVYL